MPEIAAWIDDLRRVFGREAIDAQIRRGIAGEPVFHVHRDGVTVIGTPIPVGRSMDAAQWLHYLETGERPAEDGDER